MLCLEGGTDSPGRGSVYSPIPGRVLLASRHSTAKNMGLSHFTQNLLLLLHPQHQHDGYLDARL